LWQPDRILLITGKISAKDRDGNMTSEVKILAETVREITAEEAKNYQPTGERITVSEPVKRTRRGAKPDGAGEQSVKKPTANQDLPRLYLRVVDSNDQSLLLSLKETLDKYPSGEREVVLVTGPDSGKQIIKLPLKTSCDTAQVAALKDLLGETNVIIR
jgi:phosphoribosyl-AMP cyclohydrolase